jgi:hypothetical protein
MVVRTPVQRPRRLRWFGRRWRALLALWRPALHLTLAASVLVPSGCTRRFFRNQADKEVGEVLAQKDKYPDWAIENWHVYPDPRSRFGDPTDPDRPPKPPDDPAAYDLSPNPQKPPKAGIQQIEGTGYLELIARWDQENRARLADEDAAEKKQSAEPPEPEEQEPAVAPDPDARAVAKKRPGHAEEWAIAKDMPAALPAAEDVMPGYTHRDAIEEAKARSLLDITGRPTYLLTLDQAAELAMFNSREYQDQRENLYLVALPVTQERFSFMAQFFAAEQAIRAYTGNNTPDGQRNSWTLNSGTGFAKILPTGALLLFSIANQTVFDFINPKKTVSVTTLNFNAIQPFLRGGGRAVALESLTQAERNLVYAIRAYARFRKELYVAIASNNGGSISGGAFQPVGVLSPNNGFLNARIGNSGVNPGIIGSINTTLTAPVVAPSSPGTVFLGNAITPPPSGYLNTMLQKIQVYIDQENIDVLSGILQRFRGLLEGDVVGPLQVQSVEQQLLSGRATLLVDQAQYLQSLDSFKLEIGVPEKLSIEMDDSVLRPLMKQFRRARAIIENEQAAVAEASALIRLEQAPRLRSELHRLFEKSTIVRGTPFAGRIGARWAAWEKLTDKEVDERLVAWSMEGKRLLDHQAELQTKGQTLSPAEEARLRVVNAERDLGTLERSLRLYEAAYVQMGQARKQPGAGVADLLPPPAVGAGNVGALAAPNAQGPLVTLPNVIPPQADRQRIRMFQGVISAWQKVLVEARDDQWMAVRASWPVLPRCCVDGVDLVHDSISKAQATAGNHALEHRLDLMNRRAQTVDAWRQLAVYANALFGIFNVRYNLTSNSPLGSAHPTDIGGSGNAHQLVLDAEPPLVRITERNNYRAALISFQRQRRFQQEAEDLAVQAVHGELYVLRQLADQYKLQQRQLELAYLTIDSSLESLQAPTAPPPPPGMAASRTGADGPAALTQQLLSAQRSLPASQNALLTLWISYLNARLQLYRDLELMPLDERGVWLDQIRDCDCGIGLDPNAPTAAPTAVKPMTKVEAPAPGPLLPPIAAPDKK